MTSWRAFTLFFLSLIWKEKGKMMGNRKSHTHSNHDHMNMSVATGLLLETLVIFKLSSGWSLWWLVKHQVKCYYGQEPTVARDCCFYLAASLMKISSSLSTTEQSLHHHQYLLGVALTNNMQTKLAQNQLCINKLVLNSTTHTLIPLSYQHQRAGFTVYKT